MRYSHELQARAIKIAANKMNLDAHITHFYRKTDLHTYADRIMKSWYRNGMPAKRSYMMCDTLDMNFFFTEDGTAVYTYAGYADTRDGNEKIVEAFRKANAMREEMQATIEMLAAQDEEEAQGDREAIFAEYWVAKECKDPHYGMCYHCGKCGRVFRDGIMVDDGGTTEDVDD